MSGEGMIPAAPANLIAGELDPHALTAAVEAYDALRVSRWRAEIGHTSPMSAANMESIRPLIAAAISAYAAAANRPAPMCGRCGRDGRDPIHLWGCKGERGQ